MNRKRSAIIVLLLACLIALGVGATPAAAACDCHTTTPPAGGAPAAHAPFVAGVDDCTTCHAGWTTPHPAPIEASLTARAFWVPALTGSPPGGGIVGRHAALGDPVDGVVYGQKRLWGTSDWVDVGQGGNVGATTRYTAGRLVWPRDRWASVRAVAAGAAGTPVIVPAVAVARPTPELGLALRGVDRGAVTVQGRARPVDLAGEVVHLSVFRFTGAGWTREGSRSLTLRGKCTYEWRFAVSRGSHRVRASIKATEDHHAATTSWEHFTLH
jgi:hypothetical protein